MGAHHVPLKTWAHIMCHLGRALTREEEDEGICEEGEEAARSRPLNG
jgi:hypothetical protein